MEAYSLTTSEIDRNLMFPEFPIRGKLENLT